MFHPFKQIITRSDLPDQFTYPFHYTPHPLCIVAVQEVQALLATKAEWKNELDKGKMFGVLVVETRHGEIGYLAAFSGNLAHSNMHTFFVPPVYDLLQPDGFFKIEEEQISQINHQIKAIETNGEYLALQQALQTLSTHAIAEITHAKQTYKAAKQKREQLRSTEQDEAELAAMVKESQYQKAEIKRLEKRLKEEIASIEQKLATFTSQIEALKHERKTRSARLQMQLFDQFQLLNANGETKGLCAIFESTAQKTPPAGAAECAGPKLLQYAYLNGMKPLAMAEFWWGDSPKTEIRKHGFYYPACKGKCEPILGHMLKGLDVEANPLLKDSETFIPEIIFEDEWIVAVNKPAGMLSVPGKTEQISLFSWATQTYPEATGPLIVHRLDMATSGILLIAKTKEVHKTLQAQFAGRNVIKRYTAILDGAISLQTGIINLPICLDPVDRPRQMVNHEFGKNAVTKYEVLSCENNSTRIAFYPITGRTHQLRVHAAHVEGLNTPIKGDELYGKKSDRLYLHAEYLEFTHPITQQRIALEAKAPF